MSDITHAICIKDFDDDVSVITIKEGTIVDVKEDRWNNVEFLQIVDPDTNRCVRFVKNISTNLFQKKFNEYFKDCSRKLKIEKYLDE